MIISIICALVYSLTGTYVLITYNENYTFLTLIIPFLLCLLVYGVFLCVFRRNTPALIVGFTLLLALFVIDDYIFQSRYYHIKLNDIMMIGDAVRVANQYRFTLTWNVLRIAFIIALMGVVSCFFSVRHPCKKKVRAFLVGLVCALLPVSFFLADSAFQFIPHQMEGPQGDSYVPRLGLAYTWYNQFRNNRFVFPEDYSEAYAKELLLAAENNASGNDASVLEEESPNIVVIMNESFTDYALCAEVDYQDPLPFIHDRENNCIEKKMVASIYGGYTPNSEFEFLTGNSLMFFPQDSIPYMQYMERDVNSLAWELASMGYTTKAIHPFYAGEYNRSLAYVSLGFQSFLSGDNMGSKELSVKQDEKKSLFAFGDNVEYIRGFISDRECYKAALDSLAEDEEGVPTFCFVVTVQNHGGYGYRGDDFEAIEFTGNEAVDEFLTCTYYSDIAFREFTEKLKQMKKKTVVMMFGDHQPSINMSPYLRRKEGISEDALRYIVPYILWANYDLSYQAPEIVSANYLSAILKQYAHLALNDWDIYRLSAMERYPVISRYNAYDGRSWLPVGIAKEDAFLHEYEIVQDYRLFGGIR